MKHLALKRVAEVRTCGIAQHTWVWTGPSKEPPIGSSCQCMRLTWPSVRVQAAKE